MNLARIACYAVIGAVLSTAGVTWTDWQLYAVLTCTVAVGFLSELIAASKVRKVL